MNTFYWGFLAKHLQTFYDFCLENNELGGRGKREKQRKKVNFPEIVGMQAKAVSVIELPPPLKVIVTMILL